MENHKTNLLAQQGGALIILVLILVIAGTTALFSVLDGRSIKIEREQKTRVTLAEAKAALIGYMVSRTSSTSRPGDLPCPDRAGDSNYDGTQDAPCSGLLRIGKFPWSNVNISGVPIEGIMLDLTDANGDRLWYAVSDNNLSGTFNSDLLITPPPNPWLSVYDSRGNLLTNRAVAVIISPGGMLNAQDRSATLPNAAQYLDSVTLNGVVFNNAAASAAKFISGNINDPTNPDKVVVNDQVAYITIDEVMPLIEARVAREAKACLDNYAIANGGNYPWAAPDLVATYTSTFGTRFGRLPNVVFSGMDCITSQSWWAINWQKFVFYSFPVSQQLGSTTGCVAAGDCLTINGAGAYTAVVMLGRNAVATQDHTALNAGSFLESTNAIPTTNYITYKPSDTANYYVVNDLVLCLDGQNNCK
jgi:type II secretory pathway pseudopilin PulG